ncbi:uncharacterized protein LAESUDRAFT_722235 [Laetiporus sulphureus 93-53]|uniref:C2H2-type domain-containing protein n=1 Tax=Laetiporus sulphureus 93-53 TaxID=1314785 RepID=A0A165GAU0_9APHY|nr:uncharacterized protein LAESUDRAFT_722235 [Laetiporus sulphureus 93-53]KZT10085.1 hypothetical protein LAESUDRAFT_722235 [Laetiporus sulphureus 93-53]
MANPASSGTLSPAHPHFARLDVAAACNFGVARYSHLPIRFTASFPSRLQHFSDLRTTTRTTDEAMHDGEPLPIISGRCPCGGEGSISVACEQCADACASLPCTAELSSECTEQCVVVPCNDAHHDDTPLDKPCEPCDLTCQNGADCTGLEEFFQCCNDYHGYLSEPRNFSTDTIQPNNTFSWDPSFTALLCGCTDPPQPGHPQASHSNMSSVDSTSPTPQLTPSPVFPPASEPTAQPSPVISHVISQAQERMPQYYPTPESTHSPRPQTLMHKCQWANCFAAFNSLGELVGHVNLQHLRLPSPFSAASGSELGTMMQMQQPVPDENSQAQARANALSCLWADCQIYPTPQSIPGPSTGNSIDTALGILASHLLEDHLGLPIRSPKQEQNATQPSQHPQTKQHSDPPSLSAMQPPAPFAQGLPTPRPEHDCAESSAHVCRWTGCGQTFPSCDELTAHIAMTHVGGGRAHYDCHWDTCSRHDDHGFASKQKILRHLQSHTGHRPFQCEICRQNFSEAATLAQHMRRHTQEKPYVCDYPGCGKAFAITGALTIHKRTHNGHKPFKCTYCDRAFAESSNLSKHLRTHTGARPYSCAEPGCNKSFARPDQLGRHQNVHRKKTGGASTAKAAG